jgi:hypothetical protein
LSIGGTSVEWKSDQPGQWIRSSIDEMIARLRLSGRLVAIGQYFGPPDDRTRRAARAWIVAETALFTAEYVPGEDRPSASASGEAVPAWSLTCQRVEWSEAPPLSAKLESQWRGADRTTRLYMSIGDVRFPLEDEREWDAALAFAAEYWQSWTAQLRRS